MLKYILILLLTFSVSAFGQSKKKQIKRAYSSAESAFADRDYHTALLYYQKLDKLLPEEDLINATIAVCYKELSHFQDALDALDKAESYGYTYRDKDLIRGEIYHHNHKFDQALQYYYLYKSNLDASAESYQEEMELVDYLIAQCDTGYILKANALVVEIENLGEQINSNFPDYAPVISADERLLFFTSRRPNTTGGKKEAITGKYFEDIYMTEHIDSTWTEPVNMRMINTKSHDASVGLSTDGRALLIYRPNPSRSFGGNLYISYLEDSTDLQSWSIPVSLGDNINSSDWEPSACISADYKTIYFVSNRPGGFGGTDLYKSELGEDGAWGVAENMGALINTKYDEDSPFLTEEGDVLYFSSKGHEGMGGFDIFMSADLNKTGYWEEPINLGYPVNSSKDDLHFVWNTEGTRGYYSSVRKDSYGEHDLYKITRPESSSHKVFLKGIVTDSLTGGIVKNARVTLIGKLGGEVIAEVFTDSTGNYKIPVAMGDNYEVHIESNGYVSKDDNVEAPKEQHYYEVAKNVDIKPYSKEAVKESAKSINIEEHFEEEKIEEMLVLGKGDHFAIRKVHFVFNEATMESGSSEALDELVKYLTHHPKVSLEVGGHTDNVGSHSFNKHLSYRRAKTVVRYLVSKGVSKRRLKAKGYGEKQPLASNNNDKGRRLNRRAEFTITKAEEIADSPKSHTPTIEAHADGVDYLKWRVHFPFNEWAIITQYSQKKVFLIIDYLNKNPKVKLKIHAHADPIGSYNYNRVLSEKRAQTVKRFMISNGIDVTRLKIKAFGENYPLINTENIQHNVKNRRVEFEVIK